MKVTILNNIVLNIMGLSIEIVGAMFVSMEAIGITNFKHIYNYIIKLSRWSKKSILRIILINVPLYLPLTIAYLYKNQFFMSLILPLMVFLLLFSYVIDDPQLVENYITKKTNEKKIGPIGFFIMIIGFLFQLSSAIWQLIISSK